MRVWRISNHADLSGRGGLVVAGRWNRLGTATVYCSDHPSTALLETLVRIDRSDIPGTLKLLTIEVPNDSPTVNVDESGLPAEWRLRLDVTQSIGTEHLDQIAHLVLTVPCVIVPFAWNVLLNPRHPDIDRCRVVDSVNCAINPRLIY